MTSHVVDSSSAAGNTQEADYGVLELLREHGRRSLIALRGFGMYGRGWTLPWLAYCASPIVSRTQVGRVAFFQGFNTRLDQGDLYTYANVFADYPVADIGAALGEVRLVVDAGANVGAFSFLVCQLGRKVGSIPRIIAVEAEETNVAFLRKQPFAKQLEIHHAAIGPSEGLGRLIAGKNSVTHRVDFSTAVGQTSVPVLTLQSLCNSPALVKMDIEGGELAILKRGLPANVRYLVLEWHYEGAPSDFIPGNWKRVSTDLYGATTWLLSR